MRPKNRKSLRIERPQPPSHESSSCYGRRTYRTPWSMLSEEMLMSGTRDVVDVVEDISGQPADQRQDSRTSRCPDGAPLRRARSLSPRHFAALPALRALHSVTDTSATSRAPRVGHTTSNPLQSTDSCVLYMFITLASTPPLAVCTKDTVSLVCTGRTLLTTAPNVAVLSNVNVATAENTAARLHNRLC